MVKHDELLPMMKELLNTIRMQVGLAAITTSPATISLTAYICTYATQRYEFLPQAEQKQTDMGNSLKEVRDGMLHGRAYIRCGYSL